LGGYFKGFEGVAGLLFDLPQDLYVFLLRNIKSPEIVKDYYTGKLFAGRKNDGTFKIGTFIDQMATLLPIKLTTDVFKEFTEFAVMDGA
jgi:hypothetical protein